jgi:hypothetical protein
MLWFYIAGIWSAVDQFLFRKILIATVSFCFVAWKSSIGYQENLRVSDFGLSALLEPVRFLLELSLS